MCVWHARVAPETCVPPGRHAKQDPGLQPASWVYGVMMMMMMIGLQDCKPCGKTEHVDAWGVHWP